uniref:Uncharacterized protein n=1 Tax=Tanacetum cinerariifolium TaxID=118510 RepID=A0A699HS53_TANCI|nr:hypothetical protein [Tanacetum cinerariifolium]
MFFSTSPQHKPAPGSYKKEEAGAKDLVFGMAILMVMVNDDIKAFTEYSEYLAKSNGSKPVKAKGKGKGLLSKEGVEVVVERACSLMLFDL